MSGGIIAKCAICGGDMDQDDWDILQDDIGDMCIMFHTECIGSIPFRIKNLEMRIALLKAVQEEFKKERGVPTV